MAKAKLMMQVELDLEGRGIFDSVSDAVSKVTLEDVETLLVDESGEIIALEKTNMSNVGLMGMFKDILRRKVD